MSFAPARVTRRPTYLEQAKHHANCRYNLSISVLLAWKIRPAKFLWCKMFVYLVYLSVTFHMFVF